ncbi:hypothetical protein ABL78_2008 [Leptomonas seymouri]|uniref:PH domain-containing protein n=1 Tax=Leptomonas seymouri TaxID=5684 RepID=A0A0N1PEN6_LEPSE|nr:hypothetical protein ABL78_2008 [Leptomonas seymouri]|eukprot:KPI88891.1 hypothetical protein ABL78_2008 [Leptomonas seymouri]
MHGEPNALVNEARSPLLSVTHLVDPEAEIALDDGIYATPQALSPDVTYVGAVAHHKLCGDGCLVGECGSYRGAFHRNELNGKGCFSVDQCADMRRSSGESESLFDPRKVTMGTSGAATSASLVGFTGEGLDPATIVFYEGEWRDGVPHGRGVMRWANGDIYEGLFDCGQPHGSDNTFTFADGRVYKGDFLHGLRDGKGRVTQPNGDVYDGRFVRGTVTGFGTIVYANGPRIYRGLLAQGRMVKGSLRFPGSQRGYDGEWQDDVPHGSGCMTFANGDFYKGDFAAGELNGVGCLLYYHPKGKAYYGQFLRGQPCGRGYLYEPEGGQDNDTHAEPTEAKVTSGYFQNGQVVPEDEVVVHNAVIEATRGLRMPEATPPSYTALLRQRPTPSNTALALMSGGRGFPPSMPQHPDMNGDTLLTIAADDLSIPLVVPNEGSSMTCRLSAAAAAPSQPSGDLINGLLARETHSSISYPPSEGSGTAVEEEGDDEEAAVSITVDDVYVKETEADNAVMVGDSGLGIDLSSMPPLSSALDCSCRGWLEKCAIGRHHLSLIVNWKRRFFILALCNDSVCLGYYEDDQCRKPIGFIRLDPTDTRIVTCPTTKTHKKASRPGRDLCVIYHDSRKEYKLLLRARDTADHDRWAAAFCSLFIIVDQLSDYPMRAFQS